MKDKEQHRSGDHNPAHLNPLGKAIKVIRVQRDLSRSELAERTGLSYPYISEIESGKKSGSSKSLLLIAEALGMRLQDLYETADRLESGEPAGALKGIFRHDPKIPSRGSRFFHGSRDDPGEDAMAPPAYSMADIAPPSIHEKSYDDDLRRELHHLIDRLSSEDLELAMRLISRLSFRT